jgi:hypothetical protein
MCFVGGSMSVMNLLLLSLILVTHIWPISVLLTFKSMHWTFGPLHNKVYDQIIQKPSIILGPNATY